MNAKFNKVGDRIVDNRGLVYESVTFDSLRDSEFGEHKLLVLRQKTYWPNRLNNEFSDDLALDIGTCPEGIKGRTVLLKVPGEATKESIEKELQKHPEATIYMRLSDKVEDVLSPQQLSGIEDERFPKITKEFYEKKLIRLTKDGEPATYDGRVIYAQRFFSKEFVNDLGVEHFRSLRSESAIQLELTAGEEIEDIAK